MKQEDIMDLQQCIRDVTQIRSEVNRIHGEEVRVAQSDWRGQTVLKSRDAASHVDAVVQPAYNNVIERIVVEANEAISQLNSSIQFNRNRINQLLKEED